MGEAQVNLLQINLGAPSFGFIGQVSCKGEKMPFGRMRKPVERTEYQIESKETWSGSLPLPL